MKTFRLNRPRSSYTYHSPRIVIHQHGYCWDLPALAKVHDCVTLHQLRRDLPILRIIQTIPKCDLVPEGSLGPQSVIAHTVLQGELLLHCDPSFTQAEDCAHLHVPSGDKTAWPTVPGSTSPPPFSKKSTREPGLNLCTPGPGEAALPVNEVKDFPYHNLKAI